MLFTENNLDNLLSGTVDTSLNTTNTITSGISTASSISSQIPVAQQIGNVTIGGNTTGIYQPSYTTVSWSNFDNTVPLESYTNFLLSISKYLNEEELDTLFDKLIERDKSFTLHDSEVYNSIKVTMNYIIRHRHFSEEFLMKYYNLLNKEDILVLHSPEIISGDYAQLRLLVEFDENK